MGDLSTHLRALAHPGSVLALVVAPLILAAVLALPALYAAWRRTVAVAVGTALLPIGVLATSATSCDESASPTTVAVTPHPLNGPPTTHEVCP